MSGVERFRTDIQGLRALAIVPVVLYHAIEAWMPGGFVGVDIFFVISGFLITRILMRELERGRFSLLSFYERRVRRLFPALFVMLAFTLAGSMVLLPPDDLERVSQAAAATTLFASNIFYWQTADYFAESAEMMPLLHTWSLAVEEQFYLAFPILLWAAFRYFRSWLKPMLWAGALLSLLICLWALDRTQTAAFYLPVTRAYELLMGSILAVGAVPKMTGRALDALSVVGLAMVAASLLLLNDSTPFPGLAALLPCAGAALIIYAGEGRESVAGRWISNPLFVFLGGISYSLYLWHWPLLVFARYWSLGDLTPTIIIGAVLLSVLSGWLSYRFIERPVLKSSISAKPLFLGASMAMAVTLFACAALLLGSGIPQRFQPEARTLLAAQKDYNPRRGECHNNFSRPWTYADNCSFGKGLANRAVWSDSVGAELVVALGERGSAMQSTASSCPPALDYDVPTRLGCKAHNRSMYDGLVRDPNIQTVFIAAFYSHYPDRERFLAGIEKSVRGLRAAGKSVVLVYPIPQLPFSAPKALGILADRGDPLDTFGSSVEEFEAENAAIIRFLDRLTRETGAARLVPADALCGEQRCIAYTSEGGPLYFDDIHLSLAGADHIVSTLQSR